MKITRTLLICALLAAPSAVLAQSSSGTAGAGVGPTGRAEPGITGSTAPTGQRRGVMAPGGTTAAPLADSERRQREVERQSDKLTKGICNGC